MLFDVSAHPAPAYFYGSEEGGYQPALFRGDQFNTAFSPRSHAPKLASLAKLDALPAQAPQGVSQEVWDFVLQRQTSDQGVWALTMIARVLFAAGVKLSAGLQDAVFDSSHCHNPRKEGDECPAWQALAGSVMEDLR
ncbi:hypothetical protein KIM372_13160 [Bombiscardovia nodaiensis]|uniref:Uncharacterized protein n=1 Tax=Bombiscardovia nodaiensis TaxID=2932181 RepID=A0ABM8B936_9BIFI|nr:hypothetical protein KIM372_13160 [Bombiscardovia nodaiensis]